MGSEFGNNAAGCKWELSLFSKKEPVDLEIEESEGTLHWTDRGELPTVNSINRAKISTLKAVQPNDRPSAPGRGYELLVKNLHEAIGVALDIKNRHMYTTDLGEAVYRYDFDGGNKQKL